MNFETIQVLIADDIKENLELFNSFLLLFGFRQSNILQAKDGDEAWDLYKKNHIDLIISDLEMPGKNGFELHSAIREKDDYTPFLLLTGNPSMEQEILSSTDESINLGISAYGFKPIKMKNLKNCIIKLLQ